jgi:hypothetical protein
MVRTKIESDDNYYCPITLILIHRILNQRQKAVILKKVNTNENLASIRILLCFYNVILTIPVFCVFLPFQFRQTQSWSSPWVVNSVSLYDSNHLYSKKREEKTLWSSYNSFLLCVLTSHFCYVFLQFLFAMCSDNLCLLCVLTIPVCYVFLQSLFAMCSYNSSLLCALTIHFCYVVRLHKNVNFKTTL